MIPRGRQQPINRPHAVAIVTMFWVGQMVEGVVPDVEPLYLGAMPVEKKRAGS